MAVLCPIRDKDTTTYATYAMNCPRELVATDTGHILELAFMDVDVERRGREICCREQPITFVLSSHRFTALPDDKGEQGSRSVLNKSVSTEVRFYTPAMNAQLTHRVTSTLCMPTPGDPTTVAISPEGNLIAAGSVYGSVFVWSLSSHELLCQTFPPLDECNFLDARITSMNWMSNGLLVFARENGLMSLLLVGKVRKHYKLG